MTEKQYRKEVEWIEKQSFNSHEKLELSISLLLERDRNKLDPYKIIKQRIINNHAQQRTIDNLRTE